jgi:methionine sulfoxide reductase heme-binding subunit
MGSRTGSRTGGPDHHLVLLTAADPHLFWVTSRAAGTAALVLSSASVGAGLLVRGRGQSRRVLGADARVLHEALALATLSAIAVHGAALLGDGFLHPSILDIAIPFTGAYRPLWTGVGIVGGWGLAVLGLSYYARHSIGQSRWRALHRLTGVFWLLGVAHTIGAGSDASQPWLLVVVAIPTLPALVLLLGRFGELISEWLRGPGPAQPTVHRARRADVLFNGQEG